MPRSMCDPIGGPAPDRNVMLVRQCFEVLMRGTVCDLKDYSVHVDQNLFRDCYSIVLHHNTAGHTVQSNLSRETVGSVWDHSVLNIIRHACCDMVIKMAEYLQPKLPGYKALLNVRFIRFKKRNR